MFGERVCRMQTFLMPPFSYIQAQAQSSKMCFITLICGIGGKAVNGLRQGFIVDDLAAGRGYSEGKTGVNTHDE